MKLPILALFAGAFLAGSTLQSQAADADIPTDGSHSILTITHPRGNDKCPTEYRATLRYYGKGYVVASRFVPAEVRRGYGCQSGDDVKIAASTVEASVPFPPRVVIKAQKRVASTRTTITYAGTLR